MNTPNNAAALERLEMISREMRERRVNHGKHTSPTLVAWAARIDAELATLRATPAQPDALTSQPSGGGVHRMRDIDWQEIVSAMPLGSDRYAIGYQDAIDAVTRRLNHPSADAPSQPSGEAVVIPVVQQTAPERIWLAVADDDYYADKPFPDGEEVCWSSDAPLEVCVPYVRADLATHPSADAPGVAVDEAMIERGICVLFGVEDAKGISRTEHNIMRDVLIAALAPKPEGGGHG